ncbi:hypothetical protein SDC9_211679 [bioreactor metagenome]|uniref:Uncharacterized protein n=1 Tax=bioreactor metagenome TaxID=1076179 RepID=A0A645JKY4_9ZZZZ
MAVVQHRPIDDPFRIFSKMLQVLVVRRNHSKTFLPVEPVQQRFGNSPSDLRLGTATELIDQYHRLLIAIPKEELHVHQVRTVGAQVVLDTLLVANINKYMVEDTCP